MMRKVTLKEMLNDMVQYVLGEQDRKKYFYKNGYDEYDEIIEIDLLAGRFRTKDDDFSEYDWELEESHIYVKEKEEEKEDNDGIKKVKFRAKSIETGEWKYGYYWTNENGNHFIRQVIDSNNKYIIKDIEIDRYTLSEFMGLYDKNGKEVYYGDVIKILNKCSSKRDNKKEEVIIPIIRDGEGMGIGFNTINSFCSALYDSKEDLECEIISNLYDI